MKKGTFFETTSVNGLIRRGLIDESGAVAPAEKAATQAFEQLIAEGKDKARTYVLRLYVAGTTLNSARAIANVRALCERRLAGRYELEVIDLCQTPLLSKGERIIATPTLIKKLPLPLRRFVGDMSDHDRILVGLDLRSKTG